MALSEEEKQYTKGYNAGYKDGLKDQLKPQEYRVEELRQKPLEEVAEEINDRLLNAKDTTVGDIEAAITLQKKIDKILEYSEIKSGIKDLKKGTIISSFLVMAIGTLTWYFWSVVGFIIAIAYTLLMWLSFYSKKINT